MGGRSTRYLGLWRDPDVRFGTGGTLLRVAFGDLNGSAVQTLGQRRERGLAAFSMFLFGLFSIILDGFRWFCFIWFYLV